MKILHVVPSYKPAYEYGGTIESVARLCEGLTAEGAVIKVLTTTANGETELDVPANVEHKVDGVSVIYFKRVFKDNFYVSPALWKHLYRECRNYDIVHIHSWWNIIVLVAAFICKMRKVKTVISPHGMLSEYIMRHSNSFFKSCVHFTIGRSLLKYAIFHATSDAEYEECKQLIPGWKGFILPNLIWLPELNITKPANKLFTIVFLSRIHPKKGIELLMEAISHIPDKPLLQIAGTGDKKYIEQLKSKAKALGIEENIRWLGWQNREQKFEILMQADLFALTSYNENFANVVVEALYTGTPVLISDKVGLSRFISEHNLGWICKPDVKDIILKLHDAMANKEKRNCINHRAMADVNKYLSEKKILPQYLLRYMS